MTKKTRRESHASDDTILAPRRADARVLPSEAEILEDEETEQRQPDSGGMDYESLMGESEYSARAAQGPDPEIAREIPVHDRGRLGEGPPRVETLSEDPEDMGARYLERVTEAPRHREPRKR